MRDARSPVAPGFPGAPRQLGSALADEAFPSGADCLEDEDEAASARPRWDEGLRCEPNLPLSNEIARVAALLGSLGAEDAAVADAALSPTQPYPTTQAALRITHVEWTRPSSGRRVSSWGPWTFCPRGLPRQCTHGIHDVSGLTSWVAPVGGRLLPAGVSGTDAENEARRAFTADLRPPMSWILAGTLDLLRQPAQALRHDPHHGVRVGEAANPGPTAAFDRPDARAVAAPAFRRPGARSYPAACHGSQPSRFVAARFALRARFVIKTPVLGGGVQGTRVALRGFALEGEVRTSEAMMLLLGEFDEVDKQFVERFGNNGEFQVDMQFVERFCNNGVCEWDAQCVERFGNNGVFFDSGSRGVYLGGGNLGVHLGSGDGVHTRGCEVARWAPLGLLRGVRIVEAAHPGPAEDFPPTAATAATWTSPTPVPTDVSDTQATVADASATPVRALLDVFEETDCLPEHAPPTPVATRLPKRWRAVGGELCSLCRDPIPAKKIGYTCSACTVVFCSATCRNCFFDNHVCTEARAPAAAPVVPDVVRTSARASLSLALGGPGEGRSGRGRAAGGFLGRHACACYVEARLANDGAHPEATLCARGRDLGGLLAHARCSGAGCQPRRR